MCPVQSAPKRHSTDSTRRRTSVAHRRAVMQHDGSWSSSKDVTVDICSQADSRADDGWFGAAGADEGWNGIHTCGAAVHAATLCRFTTRKRIPAEDCQGLKPINRLHRCV